MPYEIQLIQGESDETLARIYARLLPSPDAAAAGTLSLRGEVSGPFSVRAHTLPTTSVFSVADEAAIAAHESDANVLEALVPDPCYWSPLAPMRYRVVLSVCNDRGDVVEKVTCNMGLRRVGVRGSSFFFDGERWVLRGVVADAATLAALESQEDSRAILVEELDAWREAKAALCVHFTCGPFPTELLDAASEQGVVVLAVVDEQAPLDTLAQVSQHAAVAFAAVKDGAGVTAESLRQAAPNQTMLQWLEPGSELAPWAQGLFLHTESAESAGAFAKEQTLPVVAFRNISATDLPAARAQCDALQRDMAPWSDCAGYVVWPQ